MRIDVHSIGNVSIISFQWRETRRNDGSICLYHSSTVRERWRCWKISERVSLASSEIVGDIVLSVSACELSTEGWHIYASLPLLKGVCVRISIFVFRESEKQRAFVRKKSVGTMNNERTITRTGFGPGVLSVVVRLGVGHSNRGMSFQSKMSWMQPRDALIDGSMRQWLTRDSTLKMERIMHRSFRNVA